jgi:putative hydrolase of the HAD superfamily
MAFRAIFFDLDETLYPIGNEAVEVLTNRMNLFIEESLSVPKEEVKKLREDLFYKYGTTAKGLVATYDTNLYEFLHYVHKIDLKAYIKPSQALKSMLDRIPLEKYILTNSDRFHATRVLKLLGILNCFDGIIDVLDVFPDCKPSPIAFERALSMTCIRDAADCIFLDDNPSNIATAYELGFYAVHVGKRGNPAKLSTSIDSIEDLPNLNLYQEKG